MQLTAKKVGKVIKGKEILKDINLELESGVIYGFVGRNGSEIGRASCRERV